MNAPWRNVRCCCGDHAATCWERQAEAAREDFRKTECIWTRCRGLEQDRWGRQPAFVFADGSDRSVQEQLLAQGRALVSAEVADKGCTAELAAAEAIARQAKLGTWAGSDAIKNAERAGDILARIGQFT